MKYPISNRIINMFQSLFYDWHTELQDCRNILANAYDSIHEENSRNTDLVISNSELRERVEYLENKLARLECPCKHICLHTDNDFLKPPYKIT